MSQTDDDSPDGKWVHVISGGSDAYTGAPTSEFGVLEARDAAFLYVRRADGQVVILPIANVRKLAIIEPPAPIPGGTLLRPASEGDVLLTPAAPGPALLVTPAPAPVGAAPHAAPWWLRVLRLLFWWWR